MEELWETFCNSAGMMCAVRFIVFLKSCVSCPSRRWPRLCNKTPPWRACFWGTTTSAQKGLRLGVWWGWGYEGRSAVKKYRKDGSRHCRMEVTLRKWQKAMQCSVESQMCHVSRANLSELEVTLLIKIHFLRTFQGEELGDQSKMVYVDGDSPKLCRNIIQVVDLWLGDQSPIMQNWRQSSRASYQWWAMGLWAMGFGCFIWCCLKLWVWRDELWGDFLHLSATLRYDVCCVLHRGSQVMRLLPFQALAQAVEQNSTLTSLDLKSNSIGPEGAKAWCLVRMGSWGEREWRNCKRHSRVKLTLGALAEWVLLHEA